ncbi:MAG: ABC transporter substrate-binding protein [Armatimonadota bacterium]|nr:ABC transporter substrate-binding protein [Armatimonadota bacterium]
MHAAIARRSAVILVAVLLLAWPAVPRVQAQRSGGTLTIARPVDAVSLDPHFETTAPGAWVYQMILEPLITLGPDMKIKPVLASSYRVLDATRIRFTLRRGVRFHDGTPFNAQAVKFTFERAFDRKSPGRWASLAGPIKSAEVVDDYTVDIVTSEPYAPLLYSVAMVYAGIVSPAAVQRLGPEFSRQPVGTGPFKFQEWRTNDRITVVRNDDYWGPKPYLDRIVFRVIPEESARMIALRTGDVDMVLVPAPAQLDAFRRDRAFAVAEAQGLRIVFVGMNLTRPPLSDVRVRRALVMGTNRKAILDNILEGAGDPADGILAKGVFGYAPMELDKRYPYDPARARALLQEAGFRPGPDGIMQREGIPLVLTLISARGRYLKDAEIAEAWQGQMRAIGVRVDISFLEWATVFTHVRAATLDYHLFMLGWVTTTADADYSLLPMFRSNMAPPTGWNTWRYVNPQFDRLVDQARVSTKAEERQELYARAQAMIARDIMFIPFYTTKEIAVMRSYVKGFVPHPIEYNQGFAYIWLEK